MSFPLEQITRRIQNSCFVPAEAAATKTPKMASWFTQVTQAPPDPILGVSLAYKADPHPNKVDLGVGAYRDDEGKPYVLNCVKQAEKLILESGANKEYLPIEGLAEFNKLSAQLLFGEVLRGNEARVVTIQTISGTGAVRVGAQGVKRFLPPGTAVYISDPTWGNHFQIFGEAGVPTRKYRYFKKETRGLDFEGMLEDIRSAPNRSVILLHLCAHNPTGVDPTPEQWRQIADLLAEKEHFPFLDGAYQGYATGDLDRDAFAARLFLERGFEFFAAQSYAKNFGLYSERIGALNIVVRTPEIGSNVLSQLKLDIRPMYSNPPIHGARIVARVLGDPTLSSVWLAELKEMSGRIIRMRQLLVDALRARSTPGDWSHITSQIGMFSFTGLTPAQVDVMVKKWHIYLLSNGRISMAGVNSHNVNYIADAIHDAVTSAPSV